MFGENLASLVEDELVGGAKYREVVVASDEIDNRCDLVQDTSVVWVPFSRFRWFLDT